MTHAADDSPRTDLGAPSEDGVGRLDRPALA